jgi:branched-chain amino acid transport system permease protein
VPLVAYYFFETTAIYILLGWAIYLVFRIGQLYNAPIFLMGIGAYFTAYALREWGWSFGLSLVVTISIGAFIAFLFALPLARAPAFTMAIATMAPIVIFHVAVKNLRFLGGITGFFHIPEVKHLLPITLVAVAIIGFALQQLDHSRLGRAMNVVFADPSVASTLGINKYWLSVLLQTLSGAIGTLAGVFYAPFLVGIRFVYFSFPLLFNIYTFLFVGGYSTIWGVVIFTPILWGLPLILPEALSVWKNVIYGALLVIVMVLRPEGVLTKMVLHDIRINSRLLLGKLIALGKLKKCYK